MKRIHSPRAVVVSLTMAADLDVGALVGTWTNTESRWQWIRRVDIREDGGGLLVRMHGGAEPSPRQWGPRRVEAVYAASPSDSEAAGFRALFDNAEVQATLNQGLMVLVTFNEEPSQVTREFFAREGGRA